MTSRRILVVDDDAQVRALLRAMLEAEGFLVTEAADGAAMRAALAGGDVSLITLDVGLGGEDGFTLAREVRSGNDVPIVMISAKADDIDRIVGLELGADDYITKPFVLREVLARIRAVLRRYEPRPPARGEGVDRFAVDGWRIDPAARSATRIDGTSIDLTTAEFNLLALFVERPKRVLTRDVILDLLKGIEWSPFDRSIDTLVARLRKKIEPDPERPSLIKTVRGVGYVFAGDVSRD